jgi:hypothetical protein
MELKQLPKKESDITVQDVDKRLDETIKSLDILCYDMSIRKIKYKKYVEKET